MSGKVANVLSNPLVRAGAAGLGAMTLLGLLAPWIAPYDPLEQLDPAGGRFCPPGTVMPAVELANGRWQLAERVERVEDGLLVERLGKTSLHPARDVLNLTESGVADRRVFLFGSDRFSRDVFSRTLYGARISLFIAAFSMVLALVIGVTVGALAGLGSSLLDAFLMRFVDGLLAFPWLLLLIVLAAFFEPTRWTLVLVLGMTTWMGIARQMRARILTLRERDYVLAARGLGASRWRIFSRHLLPNAISPVTVQTVSLGASLVIAESTLSFLGFGVAKPYATWGNMINESRPHMAMAWWEGVFAGIALVVTVISLHLVADGLRDHFDPRKSS